MAKKSTTKKTKAPTKAKAAKTKVAKATIKTKTAKPAKVNAAPARKPTEKRVPQITINRLSHDQIAARAYEVYQRNGCVPGRDHDNWKQAEAELLAESRA